MTSLTVVIPIFAIDGGAHKCRTQMTPFLECVLEEFVATNANG